MNRFVTGMLAGSAMVLIGAEYMAMNKSAKNRIVKKGKKIVDRAEDALEDMGKNSW